MWNHGAVVVRALDRSIGLLKDRRVSGSRLGWSLHCCVVFLDKKLCSTLSLFTQKHELVMTTYCWV